MESLFSIYPPKAENESPCPNENAALLARIAARNASGTFSPWPEVPQSRNRPQSRRLTGVTGQVNLLVAKELPQRTIVRAAERKARDELKKEFQSSFAMHQEEVEQKKAPSSGKVETIDQKSSIRNVAGVKTLAQRVKTFFLSDRRSERTTVLGRGMDRGEPSRDATTVLAANNALLPSSSCCSFGNSSHTSSLNRSLGTRPSTMGLGMDWQADEISGTQAPSKQAERTTVLGTWGPNTPLPSSSCCSFGNSSHTSSLNRSLDTRLGMDWHDEIGSKQAPSKQAERTTVLGAWGSNNTLLPSSSCSSCCSFGNSSHTSSLNRSLDTRPSTMGLGMDWQADEIGSKQAPSKQAERTTVLGAWGPGMDWDELTADTSPIEKALAKKVPDADRSETGPTPEKMSPPPTTGGSCSFGNSMSSMNRSLNRSLGTRPSAMGLGMDW